MGEGQSEREARANDKVPEPERRSSYSIPSATRSRRGEPSSQSVQLGLAVLWPGVRSLEMTLVGPGNHVTMSYLGVSHP